MGGISVFCIVYVIFDICLPKVKITNFIPIETNGLLYSVYSWLSILAVLLAIYIIYCYGIKPGGGVFFNLRFRHTIEKETSFGLQYFALFPFALSLINAYNLNISKMLLFSFAFILCSLAISERTSILFLIVTILYILSYRGKINILHIALSFFIFMAISTVIAISANKIGRNNTNFILEYFSYGLTAFEKIVYHKDSLGCLSSVIGSFSKIFLIPTCEVNLNVSNGDFNVYTYLYAPYVFGGEMAVYFFMMVLGALYVAINFLKNIYSFFIFPVAMLTYPLVMIFYDWQFNLITPFYATFLVYFLYVKK